MFNWKEGFEGFELEVIEGSPRRYVTPEGNIYPSMTSVLSILSKDSIEKWKKRVGQKAANKISRQAAGRGTNVHSMCEKYIANEDPYKGAMPNAIEMFNSIKPLITEHVGEVITQEASLYSDTVGIAGRVDLIANWDDELSVVDFKTSRKPKKEEWILGYYLQTTGYAMMFEERYGIPIDNIVVLIAVEGENPQIFSAKKDKYISRLQDTILLYKEDNNENDIASSGNIGSVN